MQVFQSEFHPTIYKYLLFCFLFFISNVSLIPNSFYICFLFFVSITEKKERKKNHMHIHSLIYTVSFLRYKWSHKGWHSFNYFNWCWITRIEHKKRRKHNDKKRWIPMNKCTHWRMFNRENCVCVTHFVSIFYATIRLIVRLPTVDFLFTLSHQLSLSHWLFLLKPDQIFI